MSFSPDQGKEQPTDQLTFKVGEREFNVESATTKIEASDSHINTIEQENADIKARLAAAEEQLTNATKLDDALAQLKANQTQETQNIQATPETTGVSEEQIGAIATKQIEDYLAAQQAEQRQQSLKALEDTTYLETGKALEKIYGDKTNEAMASKAADLGITLNELYGMAKNPATAKILIESMVGVVPSSQSAPSGSLNTTGSYHNAPEKFMDYQGSITSSTIVDALKKAEATY